MEKIQENIKEKELINYNEDELKYITKPVGKAIYLGRGRPKKNNKLHWSDIITCNICNKTFTRSARTAHNKTNHHQIYLKINEKLRKILVE